MISNQELKIFSSLKHKKYRQEHGLFLVEGFKTIEELLISDLKIAYLLGSEQALSEADFLNLDFSQIVNSKTLQRISNMKSASDLIAVVRIPDVEIIPVTRNSILIDDIQDPGNLGTIIRTAHWFGFEQIICSKNSVDIYNHKVIQASMGAVFKLKVSYDNLEQLIPNLQKQKFRILGTFMEGESIYDYNFSNKDLFILGNEGKGISSAITKLIDQKITIPNFSKGDTTESLNISIAGAVVCSEMAKNLLLK